MLSFSSPKSLALAAAITIVLATLGFFMLQSNSNFSGFTAVQGDPFTQPTAELTRLLGQDNLEVATLAGGCFWCMEGPFEAQDGVEAAISGFTGGSVERPTYRQVVSGGTGHREAVQIFYDPSMISFGELLEIYWRQIDPTDPGGQFADRGDMYTTAIYYHSEAQQTEALRQIKEFTEQNTYDQAIVTEVLPSQAFYPAEEYHQDFYLKSADYYKNYEKGSGRLDDIEAAERSYNDKARE